MKKTIKIKLVIFVVIIIFSVIAIQVVCNLFFVKPYFINKKTHQMEESFAILKSSIQSHDDIAQAMLHYEEDENINVSVWDKYNQAIYNSNNIDITYYQKSNYVFSQTPEVEYSVNPRSEKENLMLFGKIVTSNNTIFVVLDTPISAVERSAALISELNIYIAIVALIIGGIFTWFWSKHFVKPIIQIDHVAKSVSSLDFSQKLQGPFSDDEIGRLGRNINSMSEQLSDMIGSLQTVNAQLEKALGHQKQIDNMRQEFIANVSHELKSPLGLMVMYCENLKNNLPNIDKDFYYDVIIDESKRLSGLVKKLLDISSLENGLTKMQYDTFNFSNLCHRLCAKKQVLFDNQKITLLKSIQDDLFVLGDAFYLEQALTNYLDNAIAHTPSQKIVKVSVYTEKASLVCSVFNEGSTISIDDESRIWESFYKIDKAHTPTVQTHAGLGLYIVRTIINAHGGQYGINRLDDGIEFWFVLPHAM